LTGINYDSLVKVAFGRQSKKFKIKACGISKNTAYLAYVKFWEISHNADIGLFTKPSIMKPIIMVTIQRKSEKKTWHGFYEKSFKSPIFQGLALFCQLKALTLNQADFLVARHAGSPKYYIATW